MNSVRTPLRCRAAGTLAWLAAGANPGHEKKWMPMENAWMITQGLYTVEPRMTTL